MAGWLAKKNFPLLLFAKNNEDIQELITDLKLQFPAAIAEPMGCAFHASWEADIIFLLNDLNELAETAEKIRQVAMRKIVVVFNLPAYKKLQKLLPGSAIVILNPGQKTIRSIDSNDKNAIKTITEVFNTPIEILQS